MTSPQSEKSQPTERPSEKTIQRFWSQPGLAQKIRKALDDHYSGKSVPFRPHPD